jgi:hypothetical protein
MLPAVGLALGLVLAGSPALAQQSAPATPGCLAAAKEILGLKNAAAMYASAVPNIVEQAKGSLMQTNLNYQKDLNEVAVIVAKTLAGREKEIGDGMAQIYCKELTDLVAFYKSPLGQKLLTNEPKAIQSSMNYMNGWARNFADIVTAQFRAEMRKRGKEI